MENINWIPFAAFLLFGALGVVLIIRVSRSGKRTGDVPEILTGEHLSVKEKIRKLDLEIPPRTKLSQKDERNTEKKDS